MTCIRMFSLTLGLAATAALAGGRELQVSAPTAISASPIDHGAATDPRFDAFYAAMIEALPPQLRAERALGLAINRYAGAADYVIDQALTWRGKIETNDRLAAITLAAMNSPRIEVRMAGFEVQLALDGVAKTPEQAEHLIERLHEDPHGVGAWELWHLGALGARGVARERIFAELMATRRSRDDELRAWAIEGLNLFGGPEIIEPLLVTAANDRLPSIRERAFCGLAQSATLRRADRDHAIRGLLAIAADAPSDRQEIDWSYQALREITGFRDLPQEAAPWRARLQTLGLISR